MNEKKLVMVFKTEDDRTVSFTLNDPREDLTEAEIKTTMDLIVSKNIFLKNSFNIARAVEARVVSSQTTEYDLML